MYTVWNMLHRADTFKNLHVTFDCDFSFAKHIPSKLQILLYAFERPEKIEALPIAW